MVICPNCHRNAHDGKIHFTMDDEGHVTAVKGSEVIEMPEEDDREAAIAHANRQLAKRIVHDFAALDPLLQAEVMAELSAIIK
jgi:hypothetical protein